MEEQVKILLEKLNNGVDFVGGEMPLYCTEYVNYVFYSNLLCCLLVIGFCLILWSIMYFVYKIVLTENKKDPESASENFQILMVIFLCVLLLNVLIIGITRSYFDTVIKTSLAPRVVVVEHLKKVLR